MRRALTTLSLVIATVFACTPAPRAPLGQSYRIEVDPPERAPADAAFHTLLYLRPVRPYEVTMSYPHAILVNGVALSPDQVRVEEHEIMARVSHRRTQPGPHTFEAAFDFSLCAHDRCDALSDTRSWVVIVE